jgi:putative SOS response-associated peptidase YedK
VDQAKSGKNRIRTSGFLNQYSAPVRDLEKNFFARELKIGFATQSGVDRTWLGDSQPRWNGAPSQDLLVIRRNRQTGEVPLDPLRWGLVPYWCSDPKGGRKPINAKCETVRTPPTFRGCLCATTLHRSG